MNTENSNVITDTDNLDDFSAEFYGSNTPTAEVEAPVEEDADDTSQSDADDTNDQPTNDADSDGNTEDEDDLIVDEKPKKKTAQERIQEVVRQREEERTLRKSLELRLAALEAAQAPKEEAKAPATTNELVAPDPDATNEDGSLKYPLGEYDPLYLRDNVDFLFSVKEHEAAAKVEEQKAVAAQNEIVVSWEAKLQEVEKTEEMADIRAAGAVLIGELESIVTPEYGDYLGRTIMTMEQGPEVFYFLANNLDVAKAIASQDAINATISLGRIQEQVSRTKQEDGKPKPRVSKAPEPPRIVNRGNSGSVETPDDTDDLDAFAAKFFRKK